MGDRGRQREPLSPIVQAASGRPQPLRWISSGTLGAAAGFRRDRGAFAQGSDVIVSKRWTAFLFFHYHRNAPHVVQSP